MNNNLSKRINDYDLNILNDNSFKDLDDKALKMEYLIAEKEEKLAGINNKIKGLELLGKLLDVMELKIQAKKLENEIEELKSEYAKQNLADRFTANIAKPKRQISPLKVMARFITRHIFSKISKNLNLLRI